MNVVITGAAGFIGSHLVERYLHDGHRVCGIDSLLTGLIGNLANASLDSKFHFVQADVSAEWSRFIPEIEAHLDRPELVLHFASPASPVDYAKFPLETMAVNSRGTEMCARAALRWKASILYASTSEAYGDPLEHPQREGYWGNVNPVGQRSCYDESKRFGEALIMTYVRSHGLDGRIIRIFNTYGPRMRIDDGRVVPNFIMQALNRKPLTIYGDGTQTRSFCFVQDLVEGIVRCAASAETRGLVTNLGNPEEYTIRKFAEIVCDLVGSELIVDARPLPPDDPTRRCPDISRAFTLLNGWRPCVQLRQGLKETLAFFQDDQKTG